MKTGILLTNLGSPSAPTPSAVRRYLAEFLWDERIVDVVRPLWWLILHGIILRTRPPKTAALYQKIWTNDGAPLVVISQKQKHALQILLQHSGRELACALGMRYGAPSLSDALKDLIRQGCEKIVVLPLYPQFSFSTTESTRDVVNAFLSQHAPQVSVQWIESYAQHPDYIASLASSITKFWQQHDKPERLLFSYHGLPQKNVKQGDPYFEQCLQTTRAVVQKLGLQKPFWKMAFQSRFGRQPWLKPYADQVLQNWAGQGVSHVQVICPGFAADCLETLEEIDEQYRKLFLQAGGKQFFYIPALNDQPEHIQTIQKILTPFL